MTGALQGREWRTLVATGALLFFMYTDYYGIAIALPALGRDLDTDAVELQWVMNAYFLAYGAPLIALGRLSDIFGSRTIAVTGTLTFCVGAVASGLSPSVEVLIATRTIQGLGASMIAVTTMALLCSAFEGEKQNVGIGLMTAIGLVGGAIGPFSVGLFTDLVSWRWFFFAIAGVAAACLLLVILLVENPRAEGGDKRIDVVGFLLLTGSILLIILGLQFVDEDGWLDPPVVICMGSGFAGLIAFYFVEKIVHAPLFDFSLFASRSFSGACVVLLFVFFPFGALMFYLALYLQHVLGFSALSTGAIYLALMVPLAFVSMMGGHVMNRVGERLTLTASVAFITFGFICFGFVHPSTGLGLVIVALILVGLGCGLSSTVPYAIGMGAVPEGRSGAASGILQTVSMLAVPVGIATFGAFFRNWENDQLAGLYKLAGKRLDEQIKDDIFGLLHGSDELRDKLADLTPEANELIDLVVDHAFSHAFRNLMFLSIGLCIAGALSIYLMQDSTAATAKEKDAKS